MSLKCPKCNTNNPNTLKFCGECGTQLPSLEDIAVTETMETHMEELTTGSTFASRYQIIEELGKGGMGRVYKVLDKEVNAKVALKLIKREIASDKKTIERFRNELKVARDISHKNVCRMYDLGKEEGTYYITMEYVSGEDLKSFIRRSGVISVGKAISIANQVCEGLIEAHRLGVVHRDLKPQNIMIDKEGNAKIMDFGIARSLRAKGITGSGLMIGTPEYMSPEQVDGKEADQRADIYSLGVILYEMVTGRVPFEGDTAFSIGIKQKSETPRPPKEINEQIPEDLNRVILKCMEKERENRYQSVGELHSKLMNLEKGIPTTERVIPERKPLTSREITVKFSLKKLFIPASIVIAIIIMGAILFQFLPQKEKAPLLPQEKRAIAVISFENQTGNKAFDHLRKVIPNLLITSLERSGYFQVTTWERMYDLLEQLGKENVEFIDRDLGFELCQKDGIDSIVLGTFGKAGDIFATDVKVLDVNTKNLLKSASSTGEGEGSILKIQIDELSREIIKGLGVPEAKIKAEKGQITDVTTTSLRAYNYYLMGMEAGRKKYWEEERQCFEKAVELDPTFAMAYLGLSGAHRALGNTMKSIEAVENAKANSEKLTDKERMYLELSYANIVEQDNEKYFELLQDAARKYPKEKEIHYALGWYYQATLRDYDKAIDEYNKTLELDPNHVGALNQLGYTYLSMGDYEKTIEYLKRAIARNPEFPDPLDSLGDVYFRMGRLDEALTKFKEALEIRPDFLYSSHNIIYIYALKEDYTEAMKWTERYIGVAPSTMEKYQGYRWKGFYDFWLGNFKNSILELDKALELAEEAENEQARAFVHWLEAWMYYDKGELDTSKKYCEDSLKSSIASDPQRQKFYDAMYSVTFGILDIKSENIDSAKKRLAMIRSAFPEMTASQKEWMTFFIDLLQAEILLAEGEIEQAIAAFENTSPKRAAGLQHSQWMMFYNFPSLKDVLARAYQQKGDIDNAIAEYEKLIAFDPESEGRYLIHPKYYYRLAKLYEQKGWAGKAIENYEKFLVLWKDADPEIAEVEDARERLFGLKGSKSHPV